jgi:hypothetical protein
LQAEKTTYLDFTFFAVLAPVSRFGMLSASPLWMTFRIKVGNEDIARREDKAAKLRIVCLHLRVLLNWMRERIVEKHAI